VNDLFSPVEQNGQSTDSDTGHEFISQKPREVIGQDHFTTSDQWRQGNSQSKLTRFFASIWHLANEQQVTQSFLRMMTLTAVPSNASRSENGSLS